jgi:hypothetical protein
MTDYIGYEALTQAAMRGVVREAAASARENRIAENGSEPISLWVLSACGVVLLIAGGILRMKGYIPFQNRKVDHC